MNTLRVRLMPLLVSSRGLGYVHPSSVALISKSNALSLQTIGQGHSFPISFSGSCIHSYASNRYGLRRSLLCDMGTIPSRDPMTRIWNAFYGNVARDKSKPSDEKPEIPSFILDSNPIKPLPVETSEEKKTGVLVKFKMLMKNYGKVALGTHISLSLFSLGAMYTGVRLGLDVREIFNMVGISMGKTGGEFSSFAIAYAAHKMLAVPRMMVTIVITPSVARYLDRMGFIKLSKLPLKNDKPGLSSLPGKDHSKRQ